MAGSTGDAILPVITKIYDNAGVYVGAAQQLWIKSPLLATLVTGQFPPRIEISRPADATVYLATAPVRQPSVANGASGGGTHEILAFAASDGPSHFGSFGLFAGGSLAASNTDYVTWDLWECDETGTKVGAALASGTTQASATVSWVAGRLVIDVGLNVDIAAGHSIAVEWDAATHAATRSMPGGWWRIKQ